MSDPRSPTHRVVLCLLLLAAVVAGSMAQAGAPHRGESARASLGVSANDPPLRGREVVPVVRVDAARDGQATLMDGRGRSLGLLTGVLLGLGFWLTRRRLGD